MTAGAIRMSRPGASIWRANATGSTPIVRLRGLGCTAAQDPHLHPHAQLARGCRHGPPVAPRAVGVAPRRRAHLVAKKQFLPLLESWGVGRPRSRPPAAGRGLFRAFLAAAQSVYPDVWLLFTNSVRGDLEARLTGCPQRFGLVRAGKPRPFLSHAYRVPADFDERTHHQLDLWENFLRHFGLATPPDRSPLPISGTQPSARRSIGLIAGSENNPEKRWPVSHWRSLDRGAARRNVSCSFGTANDAPITSEVAAGFGDRVENLAGRTTLCRDYCARLRCLPPSGDERHRRHASRERARRAAHRPLRPDQSRPHRPGLLRARHDSPAARLRPTGGGSLADIAAATVAAEISG